MPMIRRKAAERILIEQMFVHVTRQNFGGGFGGADAQVMIDDGMGHLVCQNTFMYVIGVDIDAVVFKYVP